MSKGINKVILLGYVGNDPEFKETVVNFSLATDYSVKNKQTGEFDQRTEWHRCCVFGKLADVFSKHVQKGSRILVEGHLKTSKYLKDNQEHYSTSVVVRDVVFLGDPKHSKPKDRRQDALNYTDEMINGTDKEDYRKDDDYNY